jgi:hypothetical protein
LHRARAVALRGAILATSLAALGGVDGAKREKKDK